MSSKWFLLAVLVATLAVVLVQARRERSTVAPQQDTSAAATTSAKAKKEPKMRGAGSTVATVLKDRLDDAVGKVKAKSRELRMESEKKRVERKLARDQKKADKLAAKDLPAPHNPHNLKMPDCAPSGMVYNGRRCVPPSKMRL